MPLVLTPAVKTNAEVTRSRRSRRSIPRTGQQLIYRLSSDTTRNHPSGWFFLGDSYVGPNLIGSIASSAIPCASMAAVCMPLVLTRGQNKCRERHGATQPAEYSPYGSAIDLSAWIIKETIHPDGFLVIRMSDRTHWVRSSAFKNILHSNKRNIMHITECAL